MEQAQQDMAMGLLAMGLQAQDMGMEHQDMGMEHQDMAMEHLAMGPPDQIMAMVARAFNPFVHRPAN